MMDDMAVGLADAIAALRKELTAAMTAGQDEDVRFRLGPVELEFELDVKRDAKAKGGVKFWVVSVEARARWRATRAIESSCCCSPLERRVAICWSAMNRPPVHGSQSTAGKTVHRRQNISP